VRVLKRIYINQEYCMGCGLCEIYCSLQHSKSKVLIKAYKKENPKPLSCIRIDQCLPISFSVQCRHCEDPPCVIACLSGAMTKDEKSGIVTHDSDKCIGCWTCLMVCPFGAIKMDLNRKKVTAKCDLCQDLENPACVENCPNEVLILEEVSV
jgi:carbon-monoxide dehydrogenase iron sulfur subunit